MEYMRDAYHSLQCLQTIHTITDVDPTLTLREEGWLMQWREWEGLLRLAGQ